MDKLVVGILAHVDAGKTTLSEGLLYTCGRLKKLGRVDHQDAFLDTDPTHPENCRSTVEMIAKHAAHYKQVGGAQMIALGSDFDGIDGPHQLENAAFLPLLADALRKEGFTEDEVEGIYYRNAMRFFEENL